MLNRTTEETLIKGFFFKVKGNKGWCATGEVAGDQGVTIPRCEDAQGGRSY